MTLLRVPYQVPLVQLLDCQRLSEKTVYFYSSNRALKTRITHLRNTNWANIMKAWLLLADKRCNWTMATYFAHTIGEEPGNSWKDRCAWSDRDQGHTEKEKGSTDDRMACLYSLVRKSQGVSLCTHLKGESRGRGGGGLSRSEGLPGVFQEGGLRPWWPGDKQRGSQAQ